MELQHYWQILRNRWPLVLGLPLLVALLTVALAFILPPTYVTRTAMLVSQRPLATNPTDGILPDQNYRESWTASEFINDDLLQLVETRRFAEDIAGWIAQQHRQQLNPNDISTSIEPERKHRTIYLTVTAGRPEHAQWIAQGATAMLEEHGLCYWKRCTPDEQLLVSVVDAPDQAEPAKGPVGLALDVVLRGLLALLLAVGLAFLLHYLDQSLRRPADVEALGLELVGAIPTERRGKR